jgi:hypothetical protein
MRFLIVAALAAGSIAFAQQRPGGIIFGNMINTTPPPPGVRVPSGPAGRGAFGRGYIGPQAAHPRHENAVIVPYPVIWGPSYFGGYDSPPPAYYSQDSPYAAGPYAGYGYPQQAQPPVVIINQNFRPDTANPVVRDYSNTPLPEPTLKMYENQSRPYDNQPVVNDDQPTVYLIALKDHTIFPAVAYWMEGNTLNYITTQGGLNRASLDLVDRDFSKQLNDERHVEFKLPAPK